MEYSKHLRPEFFKKAFNLLVFFLIIFSFLNKESSAQELNLKNSIITREEVIDALKPDVVDGETTPTRSIKIHHKPLPGNGIKPKIESKAISMEINFEYKSSQLSDEAKKQLLPVAKALISGELSSLNFEVEGYTDAKGSDSYNLDLSLKRAEAVRDFFVLENGLDITRIQYSGYGEKKLLDPSDPYGAANRRVRILAKP